MYEKFYGFKEKPFNITPDSRFFYPSPKHSEALDRLYYAITERRGFVVITGEIGAGKTTVCRTLLNKLDSKTNVAMITNTNLNAKELIIAILEDLQIPYKPATKVKLIHQLNDYLLTQLNQDNNIVLIIDEAQNLKPMVLEEIRMLSNLETEKEKLIQIILLGQPQLRDKLRMRNLEQFKQRIAIHYHLSFLNFQETIGYIKHRINVASLNGQRELFTPTALEVIYAFSQGIPRIINLVCDHALLSGFVDEKETIDKETVEDGIKEIHMIDALAAFVPENFPHCCSECQVFQTCPTKWIRGEKKEEYICCPKCTQFAECRAHTVNVTKTKEKNDG